MLVPQDLSPWLDKTPQPVALAIGRVVRGFGSTAQLDACIKAAEVVTRYVAVASLASAAVGKTEEMPLQVDGFFGNLAFGVFEKAIRAALSCEWDHPLRSRLRSSLAKPKRGGANANRRLEDFLRLRNELGHSITPADEPRARALMETSDPLGWLAELLAGFNPILELPLLVVLTQQHRRGNPLARVAFFAGEGEPIPKQIELLDAVFEWEEPYLCTPEGLLTVVPGIVYAPRKTDGRLALHILDGIEGDLFRFKSVHDNEVLEKKVGEGVPVLGPRKEGARNPLESIRCSDGRNMYGYLRREPITATNGDKMSVPTSTELPEAEAPTIATVREFERQANQRGLGAACRDVLYCFAERGARSEMSGGEIRVVSEGDSSRILATLALTGRPSLRVVLFKGVLGAGARTETKVFDLLPGSTADELTSAIVGREI